VSGRAYPAACVHVDRVATRISTNGVVNYLSMQKHTKKNCMRNACAAWRMSARSTEAVPKYTG
jgi:hypothetical protein